jgi:hypothetical protein
MLTLVIHKALISTGKADWTKYIYFEKDSLTKHLASADGHFPKKKPKPDVAKAQNSDSESSESEDDNAHHAHSHTGKLPSGVKRSNDTTRLTIVNSSHSTFSEDPALQSVIILPDYKVVSDVPVSQEGAQRLWKSALDPGVGRAGAIDAEAKPALKTWHLPYDVLILICKLRLTIKLGLRCVALIFVKLSSRFSQEGG